MSNFQRIPEIFGAYLIKNFYASDIRGTFLKVHQESTLPPDIREMHFCELFVSTSQKNVLRGMHFQLPPYALDKLVTVIHGNALDVIFDMRHDSPSFGKTYAVSLGDCCEYRSIFIPLGCAHGFLSLEDQTMMLYQTTCEFNSANDSGFHYNSFGFHWPVHDKDLIISEKDHNLQNWTQLERIF